MGLDLAEADRVAGACCRTVRRLHRRGGAGAGSVDRPRPLPESGLRLYHFRRPDRQHRVHGDVLSTTIYLQDGRGLSPIVAGVVFLAPSVAVALSGPIAGRLAGWQPVPLLIPAALLLGGVSLLLTSATDTWGAYLPLLGLTGFAFGLGWTLPSIGTQTAVDPARAGEAAGVDLAGVVTIAGVAVAVAGTLIELGAAGTGDITDATTWVMRLVSVLSLVGGAVLLAITLLGRRARGAFEVASPAS